MGILEKFKRRLGMAKRFKGGKKEDIVEKIVKDIIVEKIAQRVAEEDIEEMVEEEPVPEGKKSKEEFLESKGLHGRPNSHMAIKAWEEYNAS